MKKLIILLLLSSMCVHVSSQCVEGGAINIYRIENPTLDPNGPFCAGERIRVCFDVNYQPQGMNECTYLQGIIPRLGDGWDRNLTDISAGSAPQGFAWLDEGMVDYNFDSPVFRITTNSAGLLEMCHDFEPGCDNAPFISSGDLMPEGWWATSIGGFGCSNSGDPDDMWGFPQACGLPAVAHQGCFDLYAKGDQASCGNYENLNYDIAIYAITQGETGCWTEVECSGAYPPVSYTYQMACDCLTAPPTSGYNCPQNLYYTMMMPLETGVYEASDSIYIDESIIISPDNVLMRAGEQIELNVNFQTLNGCTFEAIIEDCNN